MVSLLMTRMRVPTTTMNSAEALVANTGCLPQSLHQIVRLGPKRRCPAAVLMLPRILATDHNILWISIVH
jgi:hypothetical protein